MGEYYEGKYYSADFTRYYDPNDVENCELFIGPRGEYYKVKNKKRNDDRLTHYKWAEQYMERYNLTRFFEIDNIKDKCKSPIDFLINYLGFVRYTHGQLSSRKVYLTLPNFSMFNYHLSREQINSLYNIMLYNNDVIDKGIIKQIENHADTTGVMSEHYLESRNMFFLNRNRKK